MVADQAQDAVKDALEETDAGPAPVRRRRQQQRSIETRLKIINAALSEFAKFGFDGASTRGIAQTAEVQHSLVLHHFKNKDELWHATVEEAISWYMDRVFLPDPDGAMSPADQLRNYFAEYIRFSADHPDFFRMMTQENTLRSDRIAWLVEHHSKANAARVTTIIAAAQRDGTFVEGDPLQLLYIFLGSATGPYRSAAEIELLSGRSSDEPARIEDHIRICERLFFRKP